MTIISLNCAPDIQNKKQASICIVGAGIAGLLLSERLSSAGHNVIVLESGDQAGTDAVDHLNEIDDPNSRYTRATSGRHRGLGGTSSRWGGRMIPIAGHDTAHRDHVPEGEWPFDTAALRAFEPEIEDLFRVATGSHETITADGASNDNGFPTDPQSLTPRWAKCPTFKNCNIATLLKERLKSSPNVEIWVDATVCDFELNRVTGRLSAVTARNIDGKTLRVEADRFMLTAGTIETTRLLLLLEQQSGHRAFANCDALGRYFQDHLKAEVATISRNDPAATNRLFGYRFVNGTRRDLHMELSQVPQRRDRVGSAFGYIAMDLAESPLADIKKLAHGLQRREMDMRAMARLSRNTGLLMQSAWWRLVSKQLYVPASIDLRLMVCVEQLPDRQNRIVLSGQKDQLGQPMAHLDWAPTETDERTFRSAIKAIDDYWRFAGFDTLCPLKWADIATDPSRKVTDIAEACAHPSGSTRMGTDPTTSVVGPDLYCHDVPNLGVVSASVFPSAGSANPTFTIMKLALWMAQQCLRDIERENWSYAVHA